MEKLEYNWNGYNAEKISEKAINFSRNLLKHLTFFPDIYPTCRSSVQLEYDMPNGNYLEFEINDNQVFYFEILNISEERKDKSKRDYQNAIANDICYDVTEIAVLTNFFFSNVDNVDFRKNYI